MLAAGVPASASFLISETMHKSRGELYSPLFIAFETIADGVYSSLHVTSTTSTVPITW